MYGLTLKVLNFWKFTSYCSLKPLWSSIGGSSTGSYLADPTSPIPSHCVSIVVTSTWRVNMLSSPRIWHKRRHSHLLVFFDWFMCSVMPLEGVPSLECHTTLLTHKVTCGCVLVRMMRLQRLFGMKRCSADVATEPSASKMVIEVALQIGGLTAREVTMWTVLGFVLRVNQLMTLHGRFPEEHQTYR